MKYYDLFAPFYDRSIKGVYESHRALACERLQLAPGLRVVDVGCGTGSNFAYLQPALGPNGHILGVDGSPGMLRQAEQRVARAGWQNVDLCLLDACLPESAAAVAARPGAIDRVLVFLSASLWVEWRSTVQRWFEILAPGGRMLVVDLHNPRPGLYARFAALSAGGADLTRPLWEPLRDHGLQFEKHIEPCSWVAGGDMLFASATRPLATAT